jgi:hypothetical protein
MSMASPHRYPNRGDHPGLGPDREAPTATPWRTYLIWIVVIALLLVMVILHLTGIIGAGSHSL